MSWRAGPPLFVSALLLAVALPIGAQEDPDAKPQRLIVNVTGSNIPRTDIETALPVQRITRDDIDRSGATTSAELLNNVSANLIGQNDALSIGRVFVPPGLSSANLRGLGGGSTLVLVNGRRVANYAFEGGSVDLNSIPLAAIDHIDVLKDGASAIYGADAMAGVINFILRKDFTGVSATAYTGETQHGGGNHQQATVTAGFGNLATDRYNFFVTADWQKDQGLPARSRPFSRTVYIPDEGVNRLSSVSFPANFQVDGTFYNTTRAAGCAPPVSIPLSPTSSRCGFDFASVVDILPPVERKSIVASATWKLSPDHQLFAQYLYGRNDFDLTLAPTPASASLTFNRTPILYPADGPFYPTEFAAANGISGPLSLFYRIVPLGPRIDRVKTESHLLMVGAEGFVAEWNYNLAFIHSENREQDSLRSGWVSEQRLTAAIATGLINPFGASGPEGDALLASTQITGPIRNAWGTTQSVEAKVSRDLYELPAGPLAMAVGMEIRRERFEDNAVAALEAGDILGDGGELGSKSASRTVDAVFAELSVPVVKNVEAQLAARYDRYSDFGNTVNPKVAIRWQPVQSILLRSSWSTGFRAPTLYDLYTPLSEGFTGNPFDDPLRCPTTGSPDDCNTNFRLLTGGDPKLKPEKSRQYNAGLVWAPLVGASLTIDYWNISKSRTIGMLTSDDVFNNFGRYGMSNIIRGPVDPAFPNLPGPIQFVLAPTANRGDLRTSGIDVDVSYRWPLTPIGRFGFNINGTYIINWEEQLDGVNNVSGLGGIVDPYVVGAIPRWRHYATLTWTSGKWGASLTQNYTLGYTDEELNPAGNTRRVGSYELWNVQGTCKCFDNTSIVVGIKNAFDRAPPFSNTIAFMQTGYNPQYADPRGRMYYGSVTLAFK